MELSRYLEKIERRISPAALCVYLTDRGKLADFRSLAHWMINHAIPRHETFGKRGLSKVREESGISMRQPDAFREEEPAGWCSRIKEWGDEIADALRDMTHPIPPPVRPEWMLMLVLDVQLETACFSWGYMLDPYIEPDRINAPFMKKARRFFRERDTLKAIEYVMKRAALQLAFRARAQRKKTHLPGLAAALLGGALCLSEPASAISADELPGLSPTESGASAAAKANEPSTAAPIPDETLVQSSPDFPAEWLPSDHALLLGGLWWQSYPQLFPSSGEKPPASLKMPDSPNHEAFPEDEGVSIPESELPQYFRPESSGLIDPQGFMTETTRDDLKHLLNLLHARCPFRIYVALFGKGQKEPASLSPQRLILQVSRPYERSVLLHYHLGVPESLQIAYDPAFLRELTDADRQTWLSAAQGAAEAFSESQDALYASLNSLAEHMQPIVDRLPPRVQPDEYTPEALEENNLPQRDVSRVPISLKDREPNHKDDWRTRLRSIPDNSSFLPIASAFSGALAFSGGLFLLWNFRRKRAHLFESEADIRLSSPAGAGVSRVVRYTEGKEDAGDTRAIL